MLSFLNRLEKAKALVQEGKVHPVPGLPEVYVVESQAGRGFYLVDMERETCTCPAYTQGKTRPCKHMVAVVLKVWLAEEASKGRPDVGARPQAMA
ncbi:MAG: SWIM zinc finger family protein [Thermus sp.]|nr:SWIM zinc finger family protein [Thermus sp.]